MVLGRNSRRRMWPLALLMAAALLVVMSVPVGARGEWAGSHVVTWTLERGQWIAEHTLTLEYSVTERLVVDLGIDLHPTKPDRVSLSGTWYVPIPRLLSALDVFYVSAGVVADAADPLKPFVMVGYRL